MQSIPSRAAMRLVCRDSAGSRRGLRAQLGSGLAPSSSPFEVGEAAVWVSSRCPWPRPPPGPSSPSPPGSRRLPLFVPLESTPCVSLENPRGGRKGLLTCSSPLENISSLPHTRGRRISEIFRKGHFTAAFRNRASPSSLKRLWRLEFIVLTFWIAPDWERLALVNS